MPTVYTGRQTVDYHPLGRGWSMRALGSALLVLVCGLYAGAQPSGASNLRGRWIHLTGDTLQVDTLSIVPGSLHLFADGLPVSTLQYDLDPYSAQLFWLNRPQVDSLWMRYRVMPIAFGQVRSNKDPSRLTTASGDRVDPFKYEPPKQAGDLLGVQGLNKSGSISRGVLFGNNQDLAVNSTLNLELSGRITDRIQVLASVTDNNIPIQAGGNTLELQDFDQVFIKLFEGDETKGWSLIAGDFVLQRPKSHFLTYLKKTKGLSFETPVRYGEAAQGRVGASVAISKGKFARNTIQGIEGVQGPYRLRGNDSGSIIIVLSGTERVFIDGLLLVRGQENDYIVDYNTAYITGIQLSYHYLMPHLKKGAAARGKPSVVLNYASRTPARLLSSVAWCRIARPARLLLPARIAIHPADMRYALLRDEVQSLLAWGRGDFAETGSSLFS